MNCPMCFESNVFSKIVTLGTVQYCENDLCSFCKILGDTTALSNYENEFYKTQEYYDMAVNTKLPLVTNDNKYGLDTDIIEKEIVALQMDSNLEFNNNIFNGKCPLCLKFNILSEIIYVNGIYVCENKSCLFFETHRSYIEHLHTKTVELEEKKLSSNFIHDTNNILPENMSSENIKLKDQYSSDIVKNIEIIDLSKELNNFDQYENRFKKKDKIIKKRKLRNNNNSKHNVIDPAVASTWESSFYQFNNKLFNWLRMPYLMKTHSKIVRILLLHLDVFKFKNNVFIDDIKREYSICETLANQFPMEKVRPVFYRFMNCLYGIIDKTPSNHLINKEMDERVIDLLLRLFEKYDSKGSLKLEYTTEFSCSFCDYKGSVNSKNYILSLKRNRFLMKFKENQLIHNIKCLICKNALKETISFKRIPEFAIFHYPKGLREDISKYENKIITDDNRKLSIVGIVESSSEYPFAEVPENPISYLEYVFNDVTMDNQFRPKYTVHVRNKRGWYSLNGYQQLLCNPQKALGPIDFNHVKFIIFGVISDPQAYRHQFSLQEFIDNHGQYVRENTIENPLSIQNETDTNKIINGKSNIKSRPKRKLKQCLRKEKNMKQNPNILNENNFDNGKKNQIATEQNSNQINIDKLVLASSQLPCYILSRSPEQFVPDYNSQLENTSNGNNSSGESSNSSALELDALQFPKKRKINDLRSQSTSSFSSNISPLPPKSETQNITINIDYLISKTSKKISQLINK